MEKILVLVVDTHTGEEWIELCVEMMKCFKPLIQILSLIDRHTITRVASNEGVKEGEVRERLLHDAYINLYHLEDTFSKQGLQVAFSAKEMTLPDELLSELRKTNPGMLVLIGKVDPLLLESLYGSLRIPVLLLPPED
jgi:hypothetical protein